LPFYSNQESPIIDVPYIIRGDAVISKTLRTYSKIAAIELQRDVTIEETKKGNQLAHKTTLREWHIYP
jgi:hypothetical protein